jgi:GNAT superfamily N-acetyltransferase
VRRKSASDEGRGYDFAEAVEADLVAHLSLLYGPPFGELHEDQDAIWFVTGLRSPHHNGVLKAVLPNRQIDDAIERLLDPFKVRSLPMMWWIFSPLRGIGRHVDQALRSHGLVLDSDRPGMGLDLARFQTPHPPSGARIHRVVDEEMFSTWAHVVARAFGDPHYVSGPSVASFLGHGFDDGSPFRHYLCRLEGSWVGASTLSLSAGVAGLANIAAAPEWRGRGIGSAVACAALLEARRTVADLVARWRGTPTFG